MANLILASSSLFGGCICKILLFNKSSSLYFNRSKTTEFILIISPLEFNIKIKSFKELNNIKDIKAISSPSILPVHYPRMDKKPDEKGENFKWFAKQKIPLEIASKDTGLPYNFIKKRRK